MRMLILIMALYWGGQARAGLVLGAPGGPPDTGFFDGNTGTLLNGVSSAQLGEQFGVAGIRVYGSTTANGGNGSAAFIQMMATGGVNDALPLDTILRVEYSFQVSPGSVPYTVEGLVGTSLGGYYGSAQGVAPQSGVVQDGFFLELNSGTTIPAGTMIEAWVLTVSVGGEAGGPTSITLTIPPASVDLFAYGATVPEPSTSALMLAGAMLFIPALRRLAGNRAALDLRRRRT